MPDGISFSEARQRQAEWRFLEQVRACMPKRCEADVRAAATWVAFIEPDKAPPGFPVLPELLARNAMLFGRDSTYWTALCRLFVALGMNDR